MKLLVKILFFLILFFNTFSQEVFAQTKVKVKIGRLSKGCKQVAVCGVEDVKSIPAVVLSNEAEADAILNQVESSITFSFNTPLPKTNDNTYFFSEEGDDYLFTPEMARIFGQNSIRLLYGKYPVDYSTNPNGIVTIKVKLQ